MKKRWILCGRGDAAVAALEYLVQNGDEVLAVASFSDEGTDGWQLSFRRAADRIGVTAIAPANINDESVIRALAEFDACMLLSIQYEQILRSKCLGEIGCPSLNFHYSLLPRHRGVAPVPWALLEGDTEAGVTLHRMAAGIDEGDVVAQYRLPVAEDATSRQLYDLLGGAAVNLFRDRYPFSDALLERSIAQSGTDACYHARGDLDFEQLRIDWNASATELHRWLRAFIFPPLQLPETSLVQRVVTVGGVVGPVLPDQPGAAPGEVVAIRDDVVLIAARDGVIAIAELNFSDTSENVFSELWPGLRFV